jgi:hypothetical protein
MTHGELKLNVGAEHRIRLSDAELTFIIDILTESKKGYIDVMALSGRTKETKRIECRYKRKVKALAGLIRKFESVRHGGKAQLREMDRFCLVLTNDTEQEIREASTPQYPAGPTLGSQHAPQHQKPT